MPDRLDIDDARQVDRTLQLAILQIDMSLRESGRSVEDMIGAITSLSANIALIRRSLDCRGDNDTLHAACKNMEHDIRTSITAFQFYDRMSQRFTHIMENLREVCSVITAPDQDHAALWTRLQGRLREVYTLEQEQVMYRALLDGLPPDDTDTPASATACRQSGEIELF